MHVKPVMCHVGSVYSVAITPNMGYSWLYIRHGVDAGSYTHDMAILDLWTPFGCFLLIKNVYVTLVVGDCNEHRGVHSNEVSQQSTAIIKKQA